MISYLDPSAQQFLNALGGVFQRMTQAQLQLTSGKKLNVVSDAPDSVSPLLQARARLADNNQTQANLGLVKTEVDTAETSLQSAVSLAEQVRTWGAQAANGLNSAATQTTLANQITGALQQIVSIANTSVDGRFLFSGDSDQTQPYSFDATQPVPTGAYQGSAATRQVRDPDGSTFSVAKSAQEIFDSPDPTQSVFGSITALTNAVASNDPTAIAAVLPNVSTALTYLNRQLAFYGNVQTRVASAVSSAANRNVTWKSQISGLEDADATAAVLQLNTASTDYNAGLASRAKIPQKSLFDYLG
jgi:flagellar hook-associated protein 3 FlgL